MKPRPLLPVNLDAMHAGFSKAMHKAGKKKGKGRFDASKGEYFQDVSPDNADQHMRPSTTPPGSSESDSSSS
jgi:hypothetical protein